MQIEYTRTNNFVSAKLYYVYFDMMYTNSFIDKNVYTNGCIDMQYNFAISTKMVIHYLLIN